MRASKGIAVDIRQQDAEILDLQRAIAGNQMAVNERLEMLSDQIREMMAWFQQPPKTDLADAMKQFAGTLEELAKAVLAAPALVAVELEKRGHSAR